MLTPGELTDLVITVGDLSFTTGLISHGRTKVDAGVLAGAGALIERELTSGVLMWICCLGSSLGSCLLGTGVEMLSLDLAVNPGGQNNGSN